MSDKINVRLQQALHEASVYGIGATSDTNQKVILEAAKTFAAQPAAPVETGDDPTANPAWNDGCDFAMTQLCIFLGVNQSDVRWDAATETLDGDVQAVIGNILRAKFGEDWGPEDHPRLSAATEDVRWAVNYLLEQIAAKFEAWDTFDLFRSEAAATVRSFKHDLSSVPPPKMLVDADWLRRKVETDPDMDADVLLAQPQEAPNRENLRPFAEWADRNRSAVSHEAADELILLARKACDAYGPLSRPHGGCGTPGCTDPNCDYGKGPLRCQSCGAVVVGEPQGASDAYRDTVRKVSAAREKGYAAALENLREAWSAMALIRETVETLGPIGAVPAAEHLDGPTFMHEAEALVAGIQAISAAQICGACGQPWTGEKCGQADNGWDHPVCYPAQPQGTRK